MSTPVSPDPAPAKKLDERVLQSPGATFFGNLPPAYAALARGVLLAAIIAALGVVIQAIQTGQLLLPPEYAWIGSLATIVYHMLAGMVDASSVGAATAVKLATLSRASVAPQVTASHPVMMTATAVPEPEPVPAQPVAAAKPAPKPAAKKGS